MNWGQGMVLDGVQIPQGEIGGSAPLKPIPLQAGQGSYGDLMPISYYWISRCTQFC